MWPAIPASTAWSDLELTDLWTGEMRTVAYISAPTEPAGKIDQDHGHPAGSPDGTKVLFHSCYDLLNHRLYAIPTQDINPGDPVIPVETTEGFAPQGKLLVGHGYVGKRMAVSYQRTDATHFYGCEWGQDAAARLKGAIKSNVIRKGTHHITDALGRLFPDGACRPRREYIAVVKRPDPPRALAAAAFDKGVRLSWNAPASHEETAGYVVWRRCGDGPAQRLTAEPVAACCSTSTPIHAARRKCNTPSKLSSTAACTATIRALPGSTEAGRARILSIPMTCAAART